MTSCSRCRALVHPGDRRCPACGNPLASAVHGRIRTVRHRRPAGRWPRTIAMIGQARGHGARRPHAMPNFARGLALPEISGVVVADPVVVPAGRSPWPILLVIAMMIAILSTPVSLVPLVGLFLPAVLLLLLTGPMLATRVAIGALLLHALMPSRWRTAAAGPQIHWMRVQQPDGSIREIHIRSRQAPAHLGDPIRIRGLERNGRVQALWLANERTGTRDVADGLFAGLACGTLFLLLLLAAF